MTALGRTLRESLFDELRQAGHQPLGFYPSPLVRRAFKLYPVYRLQRAL